jgi:uncharacterized protein (TIGR03067 family)
MPRFLTPMLVTVLVCFLNAGGRADAPEPVTLPENAFQSAWIVDSLNFASYEVKGNSQHPMKVTFKDGQMVARPYFDLKTRTEFSLVEGFAEHEVTLHLVRERRTYDIRFDATKSPAEIDLDQRVNREIVTRKGIYRQTDGGLELCICLNGRKRPKTFQADIDTVLLRLKRK